MRSIELSLDLDEWREIRGIREWKSNPHLLLLQIVDNGGEKIRATVSRGKLEQLREDIDFILETTDGCEET